MHFAEQIKRSLERNLAELGFQFEVIKLEHPAENIHGDYSTNIALVLHGQKEEYKSPRDLAQAIVDELQKDNNLSDIVQKIDIAGPGFINFYLSQEALIQELEEILRKKEEYGHKEGRGMMVVDHSHPNIAKRFGIGHLRSTIIGQAIIKLYKTQGWKVIADNFLGDWGTQFGSLIAAIKEKKLNPEKLSIDDLEKLYVEFNKKAKTNPKLWEDAKYWFKELEDGNIEARKIWQATKKTSMEEFERIWKLLEVKFDYIHPESFFEDKMAKVISDAKEKGIAQEDQGALIIRIPGFKAPLLLLKSDGATTYEIRDLAAIAFWVSEYKPDVIAYEVGSEQALHFQQVFTAAQMLGYIDKDKLIHIQHGLYLGIDGKKMRTRSGDTIKLDEVLEQSVKKAGKLVKNKDLTKKEKDEVAQAVGIGAIKYFDLSHHHTSDIVFSWDKIFQLEGNSAPYLQYTYARIQSVLQKNKKKNGSNQAGELNDEELEILRHLYKYPEILNEAASQFAPNLVANFVFELAQKYNGFYNKHRILDAQEAEKAFRLSLSEATAIVLESGLEILGIRSPQRM